MYFVRDQCPNMSPSIPNILYKTAPYFSDSERLSETRALEEAQEGVFSELAGLMVRLHEVEEEVREGRGGQRGSAKIGEQQEVAERQIKRLLALNERVDRLAVESNIDLSGVSVIDSLEEEQNNICSLLRNLDNKVDELSNRKIINPPKTFCIHANPRQPPLSLFMMLAHLRDNGHRVACIASTNSKLSVQPSASVSRFIKDRLALTYNRAIYEMIITIIWSDVIVSDCILYDDIFNHAPLFGEMMCLLMLCSFLKVDVSKTMSSIIIINDQLHEENDSKAAMMLLNNKLFKEINDKSYDNVAFGSFAISSLVRSSENMGAKLKKAVEELLSHFSLVL